MMNKKAAIIIGIILLAASVTYAAGAAGIVLFGTNNNDLVLDMDLAQNNYTSGTKTFADDSRSENNGVSVNAATFTTDNDGQSAGAMSFNGTSDYVLPNNNFGYPKWTVSAWIKPTVPISSSAPWYGLGTILQGNSNTVPLVVQNAGLYVYTTQVVAFDFSNNPGWHHVVYSYDGTQLKGVVDGVITGTITIANPLSTVMRRRIGSRGDAIHNFKGSISQVKIWNRDLSSTEIEALYNSSKSKMSAGSIQSGLVGHWPLDGENYNSATNRVTDKTPYERHGVNYGATLTTDRMGQSNGAMSFNGSSAYIDCGSNVLFNSAKPVTLSFWAKLNAYSVQYPVIARLKTDQATGFLLFYSSISSYAGINFGSNANFVRLRTAGNISASLLGVWKNVVMVYDGISRTTNSSYKLYIDGVEQSLIASSAFAAVPQVNTISTPISNNPFNGSIADVRIYNRALSTDEIKTLYNSYKPKASAGSLQKGLVLDMPLTSNYTKTVTAGSQVMTDRTPNSNDGQNYGATVGSDSTSFDGVNDYVDISDSSLLKLNGNFTMSFWYKAITMKGTYPAVLGKGTGSANNSGYIVFYTDINNGPMYFKRDNKYMTIGSSVNTSWNHFVFTYNSTNWTGYLNGIYNNSGVQTFVNNTNTAHLYFGRYAISSSPNNGQLSGVKIYNRALSPEEVKSLYDKGR